ncbi:Hypothetical protein D9617_18g033270 [Elsinoe fawcettii]|nr:Hypothetical protein D9617_18g033270 [Elsinoe fawcettii]
MTIGISAMSFSNIDELPFAEVLENPYLLKMILSHLILCHLLNASQFAGSWRCMVFPDRPLRQHPWVSPHQPRPSDEKRRGATTAKVLLGSASDHHVQDCPREFFDKTTALVLNPLVFHTKAEISIPALKFSIETVTLEGNLSFDDMFLVQPPNEHPQEVSVLKADQRIAIPIRAIVGQIRDILQPTLIDTFDKVTEQRKKHIDALQWHIKKLGGMKQLRTRDKFDVLPRLTNAKRDLHGGLGEIILTNPGLDGWIVSVTIVRDIYDTQRGFRGIASGALVSDSFVALETVTNVDN